MELFSKQLLTSIRSTGREDRRARICATVEMEKFPGSDRGRALIVRLTDDSDPFFLHTLRMMDDDFQVLKDQEKFLIDFDAFPKQVIDFFELCLQEEQRRPSKYILQLTLSENVNRHSRLEVVETSEFQHVTRLKLNLVPGNDADVKKFLADCLKSARQERNRAELQSQSTEKDAKLRLQAMEEALSRKTDELEQLRSEWNTRSSGLHEKYNLELSKEREKFDATLAELQRKLDEEKRNLEMSAKRTISKLEAKNYELEAFQKDVMEKRYKLEGAVVETKDRVTFLEEELQKRNFELQATKRQLNDAQSDIRETEKSKQEIDEQKRKHQEVVTRLQDRLNIAKESGEKLEKILEQKEVKILKLQKDYQLQVSELNKANDIIRKLQLDNRTISEKLKVRSAIVVQQENLVQELKQQQENLKAELESLEKVIENKDKEIGEMATTLAKEKERFTEAEKALDNNANIIAWLNRQLNVFNGRSVQTLRPSSTIANLNNGFADLNLNMSAGQSDSARCDLGSGVSSDRKSDFSSSKPPRQEYGQSLSNEIRSPPTLNKAIKPQGFTPVSALKSVSAASSYFN